MTQALVFDTPEAINRFQVVVIKRAIMLYRDTGMRANRAYTPTNMRATTERLTGKKFKARDWDGMVQALEGLL